MLTEICFNDTNINILHHSKIIGEIHFDVKHSNAHIRSAYLLEEYRNRGILNKHINSILNYIKTFGVTHITLVASSETSATIWKRLGAIEKDNGEFYFT